MYVLPGHAWWMPALRGVAVPILGVLALALPGLTFTLLVALHAAYASISGISAIRGAIRHPHDTSAWWALPMLGLVGVVSG
jgi:uncharacterized membrane protein HdeD (DUF308 family)